MTTKHMICAFFLTLAILFGFTATSFAHEIPEVKTTKKGILLVAFGSTVPEGEAAINAVKEAVEKAYPDTKVFLAYTSRIIMVKLAKEQKRFVDDPATALAKMAFHFYTDVSVLSTHIIPGEEYQDLEAVVDGFRLMGEKGTKSGFKHIALSEPLLANGHDFERLADILTKIHAREAKEGAVALMGHGSPHFANAAYSELQLALWRKNPNFFVGTVEETPSFEDILAGLKKTKLKTVTVAPAMLVAGDHAKNDMAGDEEDSWKSMLAKAGYKTNSKLKGLGDYPEVQQMLLDKLAKTWDKK